MGQTVHTYSEPGDKLLTHEFVHTNLQSVGMGPGFLPVWVHGTLNYIYSKSPLEVEARDLADEDVCRWESK